MAGQGVGAKFATDGGKGGGRRACEERTADVFGPARPDGPEPGDAQPEAGGPEPCNPQAGAGGSVLDAATLTILRRKRRVEGDAWRQRSAELQSQRAADRAAAMMAKTAAKAGGTSKGGAAGSAASAAGLDGGDGTAACGDAGSAGAGVDAAGGGRVARRLPRKVVDDAAIEHFRGTGLADAEAHKARRGWVNFARIAQYQPEKKPESWMVLGGRGAGKTRLGAEWVNSLVRGLPPFSHGQQHRRIALVGETLGDVREVMIDGPSGILAVSPDDGRPRFEVGRRRLVWDNGAVAQIFSSEDPDSLRGPQFDAAWCDELGKWKHAEACFDMLQFGLRLGALPRQLITTTPRPTVLVKRLLADRCVVVSRMKTGDNAENLAPGFLAAVERRYGGTRLGRQELDGELIEDREDGLWARAQIEAAFVADAPAMRRIVVAVDPPASSRKTSDACGIVAAGLSVDGVVVVLADASVRAAKPQVWAGAAVGLFRRLEADCIVAEVNQGGEMVASVIGSVDAGVPVKAVRARRGKWTRAEPVAMLYQQGRVKHAGRFAELEDEMCDFGPNGLSDGRSPDRVDALVWAISELVADKGAEPRVRGLG